MLGNFSGTTIGTLVINSVAQKHTTIVINNVAQKHTTS